MDIADRDKADKENATSADEVNKKQYEIQQVVGVRYRKEEGLPKIVLKGQGDAAAEIIKEGRRLGRPIIVKDQKLLEQLYRLPIDANIGEDLFELVAILLVHVYALDEQIGKKEG